VCPKRPLLQATCSEFTATSGLDLLSSVALQDANNHDMASDDVKGSTKGGTQYSQELLLSRSGMPCLIFCQLNASGAVIV
jgi:hypothetical protein